LRETGEIHHIEWARDMDSFQDWRYMMRLNLSPKPMEGIEKNSSDYEIKNWTENTQKSQK
jgi:hypothetical protein